MRKPSVRLLCLVIVLLLSGSGALGDFPGEPYTLKLGPGNEDLEAQINAIPWTRHPGKTDLVKDASDVDLSGRDLRLAEIHFRLNWLCGANFDNCILDGSTFRETRLANCSFRNASLRYCEMGLLSREPALLNDFTNADITGSWFWPLPEQSLRQTKNYQERTLVGTALRGGLSGVDFSRFLLDGVTLLEPLDGCDFTGATMQRMVIYDVFSPKQFCSTASYNSRDLSTLLLAGFPGRHASFRGWDFTGCRLSYFQRCDLTDAVFEDAWFVSTRAKGIRSLSSSSSLSTWGYYSAVRLADIGLDRCIVSEAQLRQTVNWRREDLRGMHLKGMALDGWDFSGMDMQRADLSGSSLEGTRFTGADISGMRLDDCTGLTVAQLLESRPFQLSAGRTRRDVLAAYYRVEFIDRNEEEKQFQESLARQYAKD